MSEKKGKKQRPFHAETLDPFALPVLVPRMGPGESLWRYIVTVPLEEIQPQKRQIATADDLTNLQIHQPHMMSHP